MKLKDVMVQDLSFSTQKRPVHILLNIGKAVLLLVPIVNTIFGLTLITIASLSEKKGGWSALGSIMIFGNGEHRTPRIVLLSLCSAGLGIFLLPFAAVGTVIKVKEKSGQIQPSSPSHQAPAIARRQIREIPPDYLL